MSILKLPLLYTGSKGDKMLYTLFDSGATLSCIHPDYIKAIETPIRMGYPKQLYTSNKGHFVEVTERVTLDFDIDGILLSDEFLVVPGLSEEVIMGAATLQKWRIKLDFEHDRVVVNPRLSERLRI